MKEKIQTHKLIPSEEAEDEIKKIFDNPVYLLMEFISWDAEKSKDGKAMLSADVKMKNGVYVRLTIEGSKSEFEE